MAHRSKRITFVITPEMEEQLNFMKKEFFYDGPRSEMIRQLINSGIGVAKCELYRSSMHQRAAVAGEKALNADKAKEQDVVFVQNSVYNQNQSSSFLYKKAGGSDGKREPGV